MLDNNIAIFPNPSTTNTEPCITGTQEDVAILEDTTSNVCTYCIAIADSYSDSTDIYQEIVNITQGETGIVSYATPSISRWVVMRSLVCSAVSEL